MANLNINEQGLLYMFEKPFIPLYAAPRANYTLLYSMPAENLPQGINIQNRFGLPIETRTVQVKSVMQDSDIPPIVRAIPRGTPFSTFFPRHRLAARELISRFMATDGVDGLKDYAANIRDKINETLFVYCLSFVLIRQPELRRIRVPAIFEIFPTRFVTNDSLEQAQQQSRLGGLLLTPPERVVIEHDMDFSGTDLNLEHRVAYWREDYGINSHHWHWHLVYPLDMEGPERDRKGEMFYYMHSQMLARYDMERLSNGLTRTKPWENWREIVQEGYFSKLTINNSRRAWGTRQDDTFIRDFERRDPVEPFTIRDLETWRDRIVDSIHKGYLMDRRGNRVNLSDNVDILAGNQRGIDMLGDLFEADPELSVNFPFYGDLHNFGHVILAFAHDPDGSHKEEIGVIGDAATAMRDPIFYRWHRFVDNIFQTYKLTQPPYTDEEMELPNVKIEKIGISSGKDGYTIHTFYDMKLIEASRGLDFGSTTPVFINLTRLNHRPFTYHILVNNETASSKRVTVRIFLASKFNESGQRMSFMEQRTHWAEMDKFECPLNEGQNHIKRESTESSITIPEELTFRDLEPGSAAEEINESYCGCGWPQHMLVPRGRVGGMTFQLFVFLTDYELDKVEGAACGLRCENAVSYCGILNSKFPDRRPMGFPFDRRLDPKLTQSTTTEEVYRKFENIKLADISVLFSNKMEQ